MQQFLQTIQSLNDVGAKMLIKQNMMMEKHVKTESDRERKKKTNDERDRQRYGNRRFVRVDGEMV